MTNYFIQAFIYLCASVIAVPIAKRLGLGSVLGYLIAGVVIGPLTGLVGDETNTIQHFAEFGVVMMLFLVGLELEPRMLWQMRHKLLGLGGLQVSLTTALFFAGGLLFNLDWRISLTIGLIFALSSTAIVLQTFNEKGLAKTEGGRSAFSVLLFQDIAVIPMLAIVPMLAVPELVEQAKQISASAEHGEGLSLVAHLSGWTYGLVIILAIAVVILGGQFLSRSLFRMVANTGLRELFTATTLMLVIGIAALMNLVGLSPALGTFLAGVVLANSEFRHELESDLEPFKGLLLGLFFITVGAGIDFSVISENLTVVLLLTVGVMLTKSLVLYVLATIFKLKTTDRWLLTLSLAQAGEFGFVLLSFTVQHHAVPTALSQILSPVIALSMLLTPALFIFFDKVIVRSYHESGSDREADEIDEEGYAIIAGIGRFGQIVNRLLVANGLKTVVLDHSASMVDGLRKINVKSFFGDVTRPDLIHTAGIEKAKLIVIAIDDRFGATELVTHVKLTYPEVKILVRAYDRSHTYELQVAGADFIFPETYHSALETGSEAMRQLGIHPFQVEQCKHLFVATEKERHATMFQTWFEEEEENRFTGNYIKLFIELETALAEAMKKDLHVGHSRTERSWTPPPK